MDSLIILSIAASLIVLGFLLWVFPAGLIFRAARVKLPLTPACLIGMRLRLIKPEKVVLPAIKLIESGIELDPYEKNALLQLLEAHCLAGGSASRVAAALIEAKKRQHPLTLKQALAIDLSGNEKKVR